jgi:hypothetical protein
MRATYARARRKLLSCGTQGSVGRKRWSPNSKVELDSIGACGYDSARDRFGTHLRASHLCCVQCVNPIYVFHTRWIAAITQQKLALHAASWRLALSFALKAPSQVRGLFWSPTILCDPSTILNSCGPTLWPIDLFVSTPQSRLRSAYCCSSARPHRGNPNWVRTRTHTAADRAGFAAWTVPRLDT